MLLSRSLAFAISLVGATAIASAQSAEIKATEAPREGAAAKTNEAQPGEGAAAKTNEAQPGEGAAAKTNEAQPGEGAAAKEPQRADGAANTGMKAQPGEGAAVKTNEAQPGEGAAAKEPRRADGAANTGMKAQPAGSAAALSAPTVGRGVYKDEQGVRHDPSGKKGVNPFWEAIRRGDDAALANDFSAAEEAYQVALGIEPKNPAAHLRRGQTLVRAGKLAQAEAAYRQALLSADKDPTLHAAALFVLADLKERRGLRDEAIAAWALYADDLRKQASAKGYPETPAERDKRLKKYKEVAAESKAVRGRIELRVKEVDDANKRKAAKNPNANR